MNLNELLHQLSILCGGHENNEACIKLDDHEFPITNAGFEKLDNGKIKIYIQSMS